MTSAEQITAQTVQKLNIAEACATQFSIELKNTQTDLVSTRTELVAETLISSLGKKFSGKK